MSTILVLAECDSTGVRTVSLEHLALARTLGDPVAVVAGSCSAEALAQLAEHGAGMTYMATDVNLNSKVAVKEYLPEQFAYRSTTKSISARAEEDLDFYQHGLESFLVEARTLATFKHPNIVRVARFFEANNTAYMVLEYEKGKSLRAWWQDHGNIGEERFLGLLLPLIEGLGVVHRTGFMHRDIKPDNVIVRDGDGSFVLLDFGAARSTAANQAEEANIVTTGYGPKIGRAHV